ncbi:DnaD domain protein [Mycoplasma feriruminatoris]|uniref:Replication initiation and membrane attachment protein n=1 Tax=Mycoplasma feriruminatoris TaxID=1179777 RepID=A0A654ILS7_9MOLU|nr:DnaD domain protein [Mycoplasma feriruminatoris]WFQ90027.1 Replication initiation and membrane attachment protein [Mycoplasma feriruminatoris]WFQ93363.1 replicative DNA helicase [Mycoplasma feriruminatoris]WFQ95846.1 replicative DNA helicase [Mycoplasma feriruminatoris]VZR99798.1 Replication initiation and membrane attachment protein [Mycoplasma feriruminatoris]
MLSRNFSYSVSLNFELDQEQYKSLTCLYQPLISAQAISLYLTLIQEVKISNILKEEALESKRLLNITNFTYKELVKTLDLLNAFKLIKVYVKKSDYSLIKFEILAPLKSYDFFNHKYLNNLLLNKLEANDYEITRFMLINDNKINTNQYQEIVVDLVDIYDQTIISDSNVFEFETNKEISYFEKLKEFVNTDYLITSLKKQNIDLDFVDETSLKSLYDLLTVKKLDEDQIINLIINSYNFTNKNIDLNKFKSLLFSLITKKQTNKNQELIDLINQTNWSEYSKQKYDIDLTSYTSVFENIKQNYCLSNGIINCLIDFSYKKNNGQIIVNYIAKIAKTLFEKNINTTFKVMQFLKNIQSKTLTNNQIIFDSNDFNLQTESIFEFSEEELKCLV